MSNDPRMVAVTSKARHLVNMSYCGRLTANSNIGFSLFTCAKVGDRSGRLEQARFRRIMTTLHGGEVFIEINACARDSSSVNFQGWNAV